MLYDGVMPLKEEFFSKKILEKPRKKGNLRVKTFLYIYYNAKGRKSKAEDTKKFQPRQKFRFLSMKRYTR